MTGFGNSSDVQSTEQSTNLQEPKCRYLNRLNTGDPDVRRAPNEGFNLLPHLSLRTFFPFPSSIAFTIIVLFTGLIIYLLKKTFEVDAASDAYIDNLNISIGVLEMILGFVMDAALSRLADAANVLEVGRHISLETERLNNSTLAEDEVIQCATTVNSSTTTRTFRFMAIAVTFISPLAFLGPGALSFQRVEKLINQTHATIKPFNDLDIFDKENFTQEGCFSFKNSNSGRLSAYIATLGNTASTSELSLLRCTRFLGAAIKASGVNSDRKCDTSDPQKTLLFNINHQNMLGLPDQMHIIRTLPATDFILSAEPEVPKSSIYDLPPEIEFAAQVITKLSRNHEPSSGLDFSALTSLKYGLDTSTINAASTRHNPLLGFVIQRVREYGNVTVDSNPVYSTSATTASKGRLSLTKYSARVNLKVNMAGSIHAFDPVASCDSANCLVQEPEIQDKITMESFCGELDDKFVISETNKRVLSRFIDTTFDQLRERNSILESISKTYTKRPGQFSSKRICIGFGILPRFFQDSTVDISDSQSDHIAYNINGTIAYTAEVIVTSIEPINRVDMLIPFSKLSSNAYVLSSRATGVGLNRIGVVRNLPSFAKYNKLPTTSCTKEIPFFRFNIRSFLDTFQPLSFIDALYEYSESRLLKDELNTPVVAKEKFKFASSGVESVGVTLSGNGIFLIISAGSFLILLFGVFLLWRHYCEQLLDYLHLQDISIIAPGWLLTREPQLEVRYTCETVRETYGRDLTSADSLLENDPNLAKL